MPSVTRRTRGRDFAIPKQSRVIFGVLLLITYALLALILLS